MSDYILAQALAGADADTQAAFLNDFYRILKVCCKGRHETQMSYIADHLDENGREFASSLDCFAKLALASRAKIETELSELYRQRHEIEKEIAQMREQRETIKELLEGDK